MKGLNLDFINSYLSQPTPSGFEILGQKVWLDYGRKFLNEGDSYHVDHQGSAYLLKKSKQPNALRVAITAHVDEIGMTVESVTRGGYLMVIENGGIDPGICQGKQVQVLTQSGKILEGVVTTVAPHFKTADSKKTAATIKDLYIDLGFSSAAEVLKLVTPGDPIVFKQNISYFGDEFLCAKGLDNKISGIVLVELLSQLKDIELPFDLYLVNCVQEEVGKLGAERISREIKPDLAFVIDAGHDTMAPGIPSQRQDFAAGKGPLVVASPILQRNLFNWVLSEVNKLTVKKGKKDYIIDHQVRVRGKSTGTDADVFALWSPMTGLFQLPIKYMHSTVETCSMKDMTRLIRILKHLLTNLGGDFKERLRYKI